MRHVSILIGMGIVLLGMGLIGWRSLHKYITENPNFCTTCHKASPEFTAWKTTGHGSTHCQQCHHSSTSEGLVVLKSFLTEKMPVKLRKHFSVEVGACASCHVSHDTNWPQIGGSRGHRVHVVTNKIKCLRCHTGSKHVFQPIADVCSECHGNHSVNVAAMQKMHCFACHDFISSSTNLKPTRRDCMKCHRERGVSMATPENMAMQFSCSACHKPHSSKTETVGCNSCHAEIKKAGLHSKPGHRKCSNCHKPHAWHSEREDCLKCHKEAATHFGHKSCNECHKWALNDKEPKAR